MSNLIYQKHGNLKFQAITQDWIKCFLLFFVTFLLFLPSNLLAQNKKDLEEKRKKIIKEIEHTNQLLQKTTKTKEATLDRFVALQNKIEQRESLIQNLQDEMSEAENSITRSSTVIKSLTYDLDRMTDEYNQLMRSAFRRKKMTNPLMYILSASSLNQAFRRFMFLRKYDKFRKEQSDAIAFTKIMLAKKMVNIEETKKEKEQLLGSMQGQKSTLTVELVDKNNLLSNLKQDENRLQSDLKSKEAAHEKLNRIIENVIQEEIRKKIESERKPKPRQKPKPVIKDQENVENQPKQQENSTTSNNTNSESVERVPEEEVEEDALSIDFRKNKGRLPWPVEGGFVARKFGKQSHPTIPSIQITNNGIDIRTSDYSQVHCIFEGKVAGVQFIPGHDYTVIIQHGNYYTVYSNLREAFVAKGDVVKIKQSVGTVNTNNITGSAELHFELWHQKERMNPSNWIKKG
jgi:murein hydrolase activator